LVTQTVVQPPPPLAITKTVIQQPSPMMTMGGPVNVVQTVVQPPQEQHVVIHKVIEKEAPAARVYTMTITLEGTRSVNNEYTEYDVKVVSDLPEHGIEGHPIEVSKRYSDFFDLYNNVKEVLGGDARFLPEFAPKVWIGKFDPETIEARKEAFQNFMTFVSKEPRLRNHHSIDAFFGITHTRTTLKKNQS